MIISEIYFGTYSVSLETWQTRSTTLTRHTLKSRSTLSTRGTGSTRLSLKKEKYAKKIVKTSN